MSIHLFNQPEALEFFKLYPDNVNPPPPHPLAPQPTNTSQIDLLHGTARKTAWSSMIKVLSPLIRLMLKDPSIETDPVAEGKRVGGLLWEYGILEIARTRAQDHYSRTFLNFAKVAERCGRVRHGLFYRSVAEEIKDPDFDEWVVVEEEDFK